MKVFTRKQSISKMVTAVLLLMVLVVVDGKGGGGGGSGSGSGGSSGGSSSGSSPANGSGSRRPLASYTIGTVAAVWILGANGVDYEESTNDLCPVPYCSI